MTRRSSRFILVFGEGFFDSEGDGFFARRFGFGFYLSPGFQGK
jgi:hypothetical protein